MVNPAVKAVRVICIVLAFTPNYRAILGIAGRYMSIARGVSAAIAPRITTSKKLNLVREFAGINISDADCS